jgi:hypothetical protein
VSVEAPVINLFEARSPMPHVRLRALWRLSTGGVRTGLIVAPILPGITDSVEQIRKLLRAAKHAGAQFIRPVPLRLYPATKERYLPLVEQHFPWLTKRYRTAYNHSWDAPQQYAEAVQQRFSRIARQYGILDTKKSEAESAEWEQPAASQLSLFVGSKDSHLSPSLRGTSAARAGASANRPALPDRHPSALADLGRRSPYRGTARYDRQSGNRSVPFIDPVRTRPRAL